MYVNVYVPMVSLMQFVCFSIVRCAGLRQQHTSVQHCPRYSSLFKKQKRLDFLQRTAMLLSTIGTGISAHFWVLLWTN